MRRSEELAAASVGTLKKVVKNILHVEFIKATATLPGGCVSSTHGPGADPWPRMALVAPHGPGADPGPCMVMVAPPGPVWCCTHTWQRAVIRAGPPAARAPELVRLDQVTPGAVLLLKELLLDDELHTVGTLVIISGSGLAVTACHFTAREDGFVYPDSLRVSDRPDDDRRLRHVASSFAMDISVLQLYQSSGGGGGNGSGSSSGGGSPSSSSWPHLWPAQHGLVGGERAHSMLTLSVLPFL